MASLKVAVLGASGIGKYHVREFSRAGATITAILGSEAKRIERTVDALYAAYGVRPKGYSVLEELIGKERVDAVSICTPPALHFTHVKKCLEAGLQVFCEKPFVLNSFTDNGIQARELIALAEGRGQIITVNTQWPSVLPHVIPYISAPVTRFSMYSQPREGGKYMLSDHLPHANSMLIALLGDGSTEHIQFTTRTEQEIQCDFRYRTDAVVCDVTYQFRFKADRPRELGFSINGIDFKREIEGGYQQSLVMGTTRINIADPFKVSIERFVRAIEGSGSVLIPTRDILENVRLHDALAGAYTSD